jgi:hypothetical protein
MAWRLNQLSGGIAMSKDDDQYLSWRNLRGEIRTVRGQASSRPDYGADPNRAHQTLVGPAAEPATLKVRVIYVSAEDLDALQQQLRP